MAGDREESWGKQKKFREGQALQTLDDLSFVFIETVQKLKPKVVFMENVGGILLGNAWAYVQKIYSDLLQTGYNLHHWLLRADKMGVPQARQRAIFIAIRNDIDFHPQKLDMCFNYYPITYGEIKSGDERVSSGKLSSLAKKAKDGEKTIADVKVRLGQKYGSFGHRIIDEASIFPTILGGHQDIWLRNGNNPSRQDFVSASTFPQDYDFGDTNHEYVCGMSVPPIMVKRIVERLLAHKEVIFGGAR